MPLQPFFTSHHLCRPLPQWASSGRNFQPACPQMLGFYTSLTSSTSSTAACCQVTRIHFVQPAFLTLGAATLHHLQNQTLVGVCISASASHFDFAVLSDSSTRFNIARVTRVAIGRRKQTTMYTIWSHSHHESGWTEVTGWRARLRRGSLVHALLRFPSRLLEVRMHCHAPRYVDQVFGIVTAWVSDVQVFSSITSTSTDREYTNVKITFSPWDQVRSRC